MEDETRDDEILNAPQRSSLHQSSSGTEGGGFNEPMDDYEGWTY